MFLLTRVNNLKPVLVESLRQADEEKDGNRKLSLAEKAVAQLTTNLERPYETWEMREFYSRIYGAHLQNNNTPEMLKTWLYICFRPSLFRYRLRICWNNCQICDFSAPLLFKT